MEIYINEIINNMKEWGTSCNVIVEDGTIEYYYAGGKCYKEDTSLEEIELSEAQFEEELSYYKHIAKSIFVNNNVCIFNIIE